MGAELVNGSELERALALLITRHRRAGYRHSRAQLLGRGARLKGAVSPSAADSQTWGCDADCSTNVRYFRSPHLNIISNHVALLVSHEARTVAYHQ